MEMKYIMLEAQYGSMKSGVKRRIPVLFFEPLSHYEMWQLMSMSTELPPNTKLISAGFLTIGATGRVSCHGRSDSLKHMGLPHEPLPDDHLVIQIYNYAHGVI